jgi:hypothetical protein
VCRSMTTGLKPTWGIGIRRPTRGGASFLETLGRAAKRPAREGAYFRELGGNNGQRTQRGRLRVLARIAFSCECRDSGRWDLFGCVPLALPVPCVRGPVRTGVASGTRFFARANGGWRRKGLDVRWPWSETHSSGAVLAGYAVIRRGW